MIARESLLSLETYARERNAFRAKVMAHKKLRTLHIGEHVTLQFEDELLVRYQIQEMLRIERMTWVHVEGGERIYAIADEDLERENEEKTAAVHFVRFELPAEQRARLKRGARLTIGVDHPEYRAFVEPSPEQRAALIVDLV